MIVNKLEDGRIQIVNDSKLNGVYRVFGAIAFPVEVGLKLEGCVLLGLKDKDGNILIAEERRYRFIDHIIEEGVLIEEGVCSFFRNMCLNYACSTLFYYDERDYARSYRVKIAGNVMIEPKVGFRRLKSNQNNTNMVFELLQEHKLKYKKNGLVQEGLHAYDLSDGDTNIVIETLGVLCHGFSKIT